MIDVHAHYLPAFYREALIEHGHERPDGFPHIPEWSADEHVAVMDRLGIETSLLSISSPGVHLAEGAQTSELTRAVNEEGRQAVVDHPGRFGLLASLPSFPCEGGRRQPLAEDATTCRMGGRLKHDPRKADGKKITGLPNPACRRCSEESRAPQEPDVAALSPSA